MSDDDASTRPLPKASAGDRAHTLVKAALSAVPVLGGPAAELFGAILATPLSRRRDQWLTELAEALRALEARVDDLDLTQLGDNDVFVTTAVHASQIAVKNHQAEKLEALRNAVLNAALSKDAREDEILVYLGLVDTFTVLHMKLLDLVDNPRKWFQMVRRASPESIHQEGVTNMYAYPTGLVLPDFERRRVLYEQLLKDLHTRGLVEREDIKTVAGIFTDGRSLTRFSLQQGSGATPLGQDFIRFISAPVPDDSDTEPG